VFCLLPFHHRPSVSLSLSHTFEYSPHNPTVCPFLRVKGEIVDCANEHLAFLHRSFGLGKHIVEEPYLYFMRTFRIIFVSTECWGIILPLDGCLHVFKRLALHLGVYGHVNSSHCKIPGYLTPHEEFAVGWVNAAAGRLRKRDWSMAGSKRFVFTALHPALKPTTLLSERYWGGGGGPPRLKWPGRKVDPFTSVY
jgi:hypothetical protein